MTFEGMDPSVLRQVADGLVTRARELESIVANVDSAVDQATWVWPGPDSEAFHAAWFSQHRAALTTATDELLAAGARLHAQVTEQEHASGEPVTALAAPPWGSGWLSSGSSPSVADTLRSLMGGARFGAGALGFFDDLLEIGDGRWQLSNLPGGRFLSAGLKGLGLGFALSDLVAAVQRNDLSSLLRSTLDVAATAPSPVSVVWSGLSGITGFFLPLDSQTTDELYSYLQTQRGMTPEQISERWSGVQGFINYGNDNVARQAPWLVEGADRLMEKPAEWLYNVGIRL